MSEGLTTPGIRPFHPLWSGVPVVGAFRAAHSPPFRPDLDRWNINQNAVCHLQEGAAPSHYSVLRTLLVSTTSSEVVSRSEYTVHIIKRNSESLLPVALGPRITICLRVFLIAGEPSGDAIGGNLITALKDQVGNTSVRFTGVGGPNMHLAGLSSIFPMDDLAVMGLAEIVPSFFRIARRISQTTAAILDFCPHIIVTIDSKGFCHRVLKRARGEFAKAGRAVPVCVQYVAPSVWAYKGATPSQLGAKWGPCIEQMLCILPFEPALCHAAGIDSVFVGHPVLEDAWECESASVGHPWTIHGDGAAFRKRYHIAAGPEDGPVICFLPGSRQQEIHRLLPICKQVFTMLRKEWPNLTAVVVTIAGPVGDGVRRHVAAWEGATVTCMPVTEQERYDAFAACDVAVAASGTVIMQLLLARVPTVVAYKAHWLTEFVARRLAAVNHLALPNILAGQEIVPEAIFSECTPERLAQHVRRLLGNRFERELQAENAERLLALLAPPLSNHCASSSPDWTGLGDPLISKTLREEGSSASTGKCTTRLYERPSTIAAQAILETLKRQSIYPLGMFSL